MVRKRMAWALSVAAAHTRAERSARATVGGDRTRQWEELAGREVLWAYGKHYWEVELALVQVQDEARWAFRHACNRVRPSRASAERREAGRSSQRDPHLVGHPHGKSKISVVYVRQGITQRQARLVA